jgi:PTS system galactitol-specific IIC component
MAGVLVSGLVPITEIASEWVKKRFPTKSLYFGISGEIAFKNPAVLSVGILMVPLTILISTILPFNTMMPFADIPYLPIFVVFGTVACNGNMFRGLINGIVIVCGILWFGSDLAVVSQALAEKAHLNVPKEMMASSIDGGSHAISYIFFKMFDVLKDVNSALLCGFALVITGMIIYILKLIFNIKKKSASTAALTENRID